MDLSWVELDATNILPIQQNYYLMRGLCEFLSVAKAAILFYLHGSFIFLQIFENLIIWVNEKHCE